MQHLNYDRIIQNALRGAISQVLQEAVKNGGKFPGGHHVYISFKTGHPGVVIAENLRERFPIEMTIVLQHTYERLKVERDRFSVDLAFNGIWTTITVPYAAVTTIADPTAEFVLEFEIQDDPEPASTQPSLSIVKSSVDDADNVINIDFGKK